MDNKRPYLPPCVSNEHTFLSASKILIRYFVSFWKSGGAHLRERERERIDTTLSKYSTFHKY